MTCVALTLHVIAAAAIAQPAPRHPVRVVQGGESRTEVVVKRQQFRWTTVLESQQFAEITATLSAARASATITDAAGAVISRSGPLREFSSGWLAFQGRGRYTVTIDVQPLSARPAEVTVLVSQRDLEASDAARLKGQRAFAEAAAARYTSPPALVQAIRSYDRAAEVLRDVDPRRAAEARLGLSHLYEQRSLFDQALAAAAASLAGFAEAQDAGGQALAHSQLGALRLATGDPRGADEAHRSALALWQAAGDERGIAIAQADLAAADLERDGDDRLDPVMRASIEVWRKVGDRVHEAAGLKALANRAHAAGPSPAVVEQYEAALRALNGIDQPRLEAEIRNDLGVLFNGIGDFSLADAQLRRALAAARRSGVSTVVAHALMNAGTNQADLRQLSAATTALERSRALFAELGEHAIEATILNNLASIYHDRGENARALAAVVSALERFVDAGNRRGEMIARTSLGRVQCDMGRMAEGIAQLRDARQLAQRAGDSNQHALILSLLGECEVARADLAAALEYTGEAIKLAESLRAQFGREDLRLSYAASARPIIERHVRVLMARHAAEPNAGWNAAAFEASERFRARSFLEESTRRRAERLTLSADDRRARDRLIARIREAPSDLEAADAVSAYYAWLASLPSAERRTVDLTGDAITIADVRAAMGRDALALVFMLGRTRGDVWLLGADGLRHAALPAKRTVEAVVAEFRSGIRRRSTSLRETEQRRADEEIQRAARRLSALILQPLSRHLRGRKIYVVADGSLQTVPFAALPAPGGTGQPLIVTHEIVTVPSLAVLKALGQRATGRLNDLTIFADPIYQPRERQGAPRVATRAASASAGESTASRFSQLPWTRDEEAAIAMAAHPRTVEIHTGAEVTRARLVGALSRAGTVHVAVHGHMDDLREERSALVLSLFDAQGRPQDGFVRAVDIERLPIASELVVLSACETAAGREVAGEGMLGLTRAFLVAGARQVIGSLWNVRDSATAELMAGFYQSLLKEGVPPSVALRRAQLTLSRVPRWQSPYFWAGFVITGP